MTLHAGFCSKVVDHEPASGLFLAGFGDRGPSASVREFPQIRVLALADPDAGLKVAVVSCDYCFFDQKLHDRLRTALLAQGIYAIIACTHNHAAPSVYHVNPLFGIETEEWYVMRVEARIISAVEKAFRSSLSPVTKVEIHRSPFCGNPTMNRSIITERPSPDGPTLWMHKRLFADTPASVFTAVDRELVALKIATQNGAEIILVNFACHPVVLERADNACDRDFVGHLLRQLERGHPNRHSLFMNGALGDVNPALWEFGVAAAPRYGKLLAAETEAVLAQAGILLEPSIRVNEAVAAIPYIGLPDHHVTMSCLWFGDQPIITIPGELYSQPGLEIKLASSPSPVLFGLAGGSIGYIPSAEVLGDPDRFANDTGLRTYCAVPLFVPGRHGNPVGMPAQDMSGRIIQTAARLIASLCLHAGSA